MVNRSSCASGSGYVPSYSIGFCVAITMNGRASSYETPSTVTCCSCMHSSKADCVFGEARFISSTRRRLAKTGPGLNWNSFERWLNMFTPVTSDGSRSGVNCMRENETSSDRASAFASIVFPTPGKSSRIRCPSLTRQRTQSRSVSSGACSTRARLSTTVRMVSAAAAVSTRSLRGSLTQQLLSRIYDRHSDLVFRSLGHAALARRAQQDDLVVARVEADVVTRDVVVDDEVDALPLQFVARALETLVAGLGREPDQYLAVRPALCERAQNVGRRLQGHLPDVLVLRALVLQRIRRPVVGDGSRHQDQIGVCVGERGLQHGLRGRRLHELDPAWRGDRNVRRQQRHVRAAFAGLLSQRNPHPARGAVAHEADGVQRLASSAGCDQHATACEGIAFTQQLAAA